MQSSKRLCFIAFHVLEQKLKNQKPDQNLLNEIPNESCPLFVTYHKNEDDLRGCIGNLGGLNLRTGIPEYAIIAAMQDPRFDPISVSELPTLSVAVSLLVNYQPVDALDWEVGKHGILINYKGKSGTYLPEVALEQNWDQKTTLQQLLLKAGVRVKLTDEVIKEIKCTRYESSKETISWAEYEQMKK
ncbi:AMMECR1-domain_containing protein [Hexamita inflata]|uniref:AMMECR1-domain containing protein n=1 Tax=Hexamita inflata TaxID=28002 RepID=A0AA86Q0K3_9EUKA|nr:AMMECR1-domain containing protein [Hexamita inflata]